MKEGGVQSFPPSPFHHCRDIRILLSTIKHQGIGHLIPGGNGHWENCNISLTKKEEKWPFFQMKKVGSWFLLLDLLTEGITWANNIHLRYISLGCGWLEADTLGEGGADMFLAYIKREKAEFLFIISEDGGYTFISCDQPTPTSLSCGIKQILIILVIQELNTSRYNKHGHKADGQLISGPSSNDI